MDCRSCLGTGARGIDVDAQTGHVRVWDEGDCETCGGSGENPDFCSCGQPKRDPDDAQCPSCMEADASDEAYERFRDCPEVLDGALAEWAE